MINSKPLQINENGNLKQMFMLQGWREKGTEDQDTGQKKANNKTKDLSSNITILNMWMV